MGERLKKYISLVENRAESPIESEEQEKLKDDLLIQISFFQHERLIHLIVTVTFALLSIITFLAALISEQTALWILLALFLALLIPYIVHYYRLENGVQKLYSFYDKLRDNAK